MIDLDTDIVSKRVSNAFRHVYLKTFFENIGLEVLIGIKD
jgi:hypothetical protein